MGNHEYCEDCGESNFHLNRPCDPAKVAARKKQSARAEKTKQGCINRMKSALADAGINYTLDSYGNAIVSYTSFPEQ